MLHYDVNAGNPVVFKSRSAKARYHKDLDQTVRARSGVKKANRERVVLEENTHAATANRFEGRPGGGNPVRNADGEIRSKRVAPQGEAGEYRLLCKPIPALL